MQELREQLKNAKNELNNIIIIPPGQENELVLEIIEMKELEEQLKKYIKQGEEILKQNFKKN